MRCKEVMLVPRGLPLKKRFNLFLLIQSHTLPKRELGCEVVYDPDTTRTLSCLIHWR